MLLVASRPLEGHDWLLVSQSNTIAGILAPQYICTRAVDPSTCPHSVDIADHSLKDEYDFPPPLILQIGPAGSVFHLFYSIFAGVVKLALGDHSRLPVRGNCLLGMLWREMLRNPN